MFHRPAAAVSVVLLAAGKSRRMGEHKLLLPFDGTTVIGRTLDNLLAARVGEVVAVLGFRADEVKKAVGGRVVTVFNPDYALGMSTSLRVGLEALAEAAPLVMVALADQPLVTTLEYDRLIEAALTSEKGMVLPVYRGQRGNPILVARRYVPELVRMSGDVGGRELLRSYPQDILEVGVETEGVIININTPEEYQRQLAGLDTRRIGHHV
jgi:molybdenum cofactor cytidylyltransferase